ncbi:MAG: tripartite tricarboxylate transporter substrate binding protein [Betaproteobacteria bacterium PRO3]|nr:tripartite tricarboxylate transporter substrate binding protein [Betaproteobacteria bacterium PRO3]
MFRLLCAVLALVAAAAPAGAQTFPAKPIRLIVPFPPGGGTDISSRLVASELAKSTGWTIVVENKAGASGMIGLAEAAKAPNEGYDIVMGQADNVIIAAPTMKSPPLDPLKDLTPVIQIASSPSLVMTRADSPFRTLGDAIAAAKSGATVNYGTAGHGTFPQLAVDLLMQNGGFKWVEVPYKGASPAITDLLGGHVQLAALSVASGLPHVRSGKLRGLAVTSPKRSPALPDVPTVAESGFPGFDATGWLGIFVPNGTPPAVIARLQAEIAKVMQKPEVQQQMVTNGVEARWTPGPEFGAMIAREGTKWHKIMRDAGIRPE